GRGDRNATGGVDTARTALRDRSVRQIRGHGVVREPGGGHRALTPILPTAPRSPRQPTQPAQSMQSEQATHAMQRGHRRHPTLNTERRMAALKKVSTLPATAALATVTAL